MKKDNRFGDEGCCMLCEALKINTTLTKLNLNCDKTINRIKKNAENKYAYNS